MLCDCNDLVGGQAYDETTYSAQSFEKITKNGVSATSRQFVVHGRL